LTCLAHFLVRFCGSGGPNKFRLFNAEIGDTVVGNGKIALLVYVRASSDFKPVVSGKGQVRC
jgi:hypothetical protein